jgi:hypothetical protein
MSVMSPFTYPNMSPYSHGVITVFWDLQIFSCPTNKNVTHVHLVVSPAGKTFGTLMTSDSAPFAVWRPPALGDLRPGLRTIPRLHHGDWVLQKGVKVCVRAPSFQSKGSSGSAPEGEPQFWDLCGLWPSSLTVAPHRQGSIPMSRSCDSREEIPPKAWPLLVGVEPSLI